jgi:acyl dehydratase
MEKIKPGETQVHEVRFSRADVLTFARITGDNNPLHIDEEYAKTTPFGRCIVHGFLAGAVFSKVFGTLFPGEGTIYMWQDMAFLAPVFMDEPYIARFEVLEVNEEKHRGIIKCTLENADGKICINGQAKLKHDARF